MIRGKHSTYEEDATAHLDKHWGPSVLVGRYPLNNVPARPMVSVRRWNQGKSTCYSTVGTPTTGPLYRSEFHLRSLSRDDESLAEVLVVTADFHASSVALDVGHTVSLGRPIARGSILTHMYVTLPYYEGPSLEWLYDAGKNPVARFLWLVPISAQERETKRACGVDAFEELLEQAQARVDLLDLGRASFSG